MNKIKYILKSLVHTNKAVFTLQKLMVLIAVLSSIIQIALGRIHNQAAFKVASTVAIYAFISQICLLLLAVSIMRINEKRKYLTFVFLLIIISSITILIYITTLFGDIYYQNALEGLYPYEDCVLIIYAIEDSAFLFIASLVCNVIVLGLLITEIIAKRRRTNGLSYKR